MDNDRPFAILCTACYKYIATAAKLGENNREKDLISNTFEHIFSEKRKKDRSLCYTLRVDTRKVLLESRGANSYLFHLKHQLCADGV